MSLATSLLRRLETLEQRRRGPLRPPSVFVAWGRDEQGGREALNRARSSQSIKQGDRVIVGSYPRAPMPESRWTDVLDLPDDQLSALAYPHGRQAASEGHVDRRRLEGMSDAELAHVIVNHLSEAA